MTKEQHEHFTKACLWFGEQLEKIFGTEAPTMERQEPAKEWEILEFQLKESTLVFEIFPDKTYGKKGGMVGGVNLENMLTIGTSVASGHWLIHSVRRLSDNTVWTVGDEDETGEAIQSFNIVGDIMYARMKSADYGLRLLGKPVKQPVFTTADGVEVYEKDTPIYKTSAMGWIEIFHGIPDEGEQWYSTPEAALKAYDEWLYTRPVLSIWDFDGCSETGDALTARLKQLVKDKIAKR